MPVLIGATDNPWADRARGLKVQRLALILWQAGARRAGDVLALDEGSRGLALAILGDWVGRPTMASEATWRGVASYVGWLGGGSGGRRKIATAPNRLGVPLTRDDTEHGGTKIGGATGRRARDGGVETLEISTEKGGD